MPQKCATTKYSRQVSYFLFIQYQYVTIFHVVCFEIN